MPHKAPLENKDQLTEEDIISSNHSDSNHSNSESDSDSAEENDVRMRTFIG